MSAPYELLAGGWTAWLADSGTALPQDLDAAPPVAYEKLGNSGSDDYNEDGVVLSNEQALEYFRGLGKTGRRKAWRTEEDPMVSLTVHDSRIETIRKAHNNNAITTTAAGASISGRKAISLYKGHAVREYALLLRSDEGSPYGDDYIMQIWVPRVVVDAIGDFEAVKGTPLGVGFEFALLYDSTYGFGEIAGQTAVKSS